jgi:ElaB/YqjD/DUF883 family membrane-anchored ribosome-binding protein
MTAQAEVAAAREEVLQTRAHISATLAEIDARIAGQVQVAKQHLDPLEWARMHPWLSLATAAGVGLVVSATRADRKVVAAAVEGTRLAGNAAAASALGAPSLAQRALHGVGGYVDTIATGLLLGFIERLKEPQTAEAQSMAAQPAAQPATYTGEVTTPRQQMEVRHG